MGRQLLIKIYRSNCNERLSPLHKYGKTTPVLKYRSNCLNIQSIASSKKKACFWNFLDSINCDILCGCETWLKPEILDAELLPPNSNYNIHRKDRHDGYGGSIILIKDNIQHERIDIDTPCDIVFVKIECANKESLVVGSVYRPTNNIESYAHDLFDAISKVSKKFRKSAIWITGDFNLPDIDWLSNTIQGYQYRKSINETFLQMEPDLGLTQMIDFHTRGTNILDLFFTNRPDLVNQYSPMPGISDHHAVFVDTNMCAPRIKQPKRTLYMWGKANIDNIKKKCSSLSDTIIDAVSATANIDEVWSLFKNGCQLIISEEVPSRQSAQRLSQPWANRDVRRITRQKRRWFRRARRTNSQSDWNRYKDIKHRAQLTCRKAHDNHVSSMLSEDHDNPKVFWQYIKSRKKDNFGVSPLRKDGLTYNSSKQKADILNDQFTSVFTKEDLSNPPKLPKRHIPSLSQIKVTVRGVFKLLQGLKPHKAAGPDKVPTRLLKLGAQELAPGLTMFYQLSLDQGKLPTDWKTANVSPVFKKGNRSSPANYRPISLTSVSCKILEHVIHSNIMSHFEAHDILTDSQHGFRKHRSCDTQLITTVNNLAKGLDKSEQIDAILLDFSKAFDKVAHSRLLLKLENYGVRGNLLKWVQDFLSGRTQQVVLEGSCSDTTPVTSGVPQGSVLGPLLFLAFINDLPSRVKSRTGMFADDCLLFRTIKGQADAHALQKDLDSLQDWEKEWQMEFNADKCEVIRITSKKNPIIYSYRIHQTALRSTDQAKYLGVTITPELSWKCHIDNITKKANSTMAFLRRNIRSSPRDTKAKAYKTYVRPIVEYASSVWSPAIDSHIKQLEMVQRRAAGFVCSDYTRQSSVSEMISSLGWDTLQQRRDNARTTMLYKIKHNLVDITPDPPLPNARTSRGNPEQFSQLYVQKNVYQNSFFLATIVLWNRLPQHVVEQPTLEGFQSALGRSAANN